MIRYCIQAMNVMANTSDGLSRAARFGDGDGEVDGNDHVYVSEIQSGDLFDDEPPAPPEYLAATQLLFSAWLAPDTPEGAELRRKARETYEHLARRDAELWAKLFPPEPPPPERYQAFSDMFAALARLPQGAIEFRVGAYGRTNIFYLRQLTGDEAPLGEFIAWSSDEARAALSMLDEAALKDEAAFWLDECIFVRCQNDMPRAPLRLATPLFEKRLADQERLLRGEIKKGTRAFGFYPLDGHK